MQRTAEFGGDIIILRKAGLEWGLNDEVTTRSFIVNFKFPTYEVHHACHACHNIHLTAARCISELSCHSLKVQIYRHDP